jgi:hypothetical protein
VENFYLLWSSKPLPELERIRAVKPDEQWHHIIVKDPGQVRMLGALLRQWAVSTVKNTNDNRTVTIRRTGDALAHLIRLQHLSSGRKLK